MVEKANGEWVRFDDAQEAIAAAVAAEQKRVWDVLSNEMDRLWHNEQRERSRCVGFVRSMVFPYGEPQPINPLAGERRGM